MEKQINIYNQSDVKIEYYANQFENQLMRRKKLSLSLTLECGNLPILFSEFHHLDGGLLFTTDYKGGFHYYDMNSLNQTPAFSLTILKDAGVSHISMPPD